MLQEHSVMIKPEYGYETYNNRSASLCRTERCFKINVLNETSH